MARWRDIKKGKVVKNKKEINKDEPTYIVSVSPLFRIKSFITDMFMIMMPLMYLTTYVFMDGADAFKNNDMAHWITTAFYGAITVIFWVKKGQTPGFKAYDIILIDDNTKKPVSWGIAIARYMMFLVSAISIVGAILPFFRKDKKTLQDLVMQTSVVKVDE